MRTTRTKRRPLWIGTLSADEMFDQWLRLLDAREEVERGDEEPFLFTLKHWAGREGSLAIC